MATTAASSTTNAHGGSIDFKSYCHADVKTDMPVVRKQDDSLPSMILSSRCETADVVCRPICPERIGMLDFMELYIASATFYIVSFIAYVCSFAEPWLVPAATNVTVVGPFVKNVVAGRRRLFYSWDTGCTNSGQPNLEIWQSGTWLHKSVNFILHIVLITSPVLPTLTGWLFQYLSHSITAIEVFVVSEFFMCMALFLTAPLILMRCRLKILEYVLHTPLALIVLMRRGVRYAWEMMRFMLNDYVPPKM
jgi:hypothetical protein